MALGGYRAMAFPLVFRQSGWILGEFPGWTVSGGFTDFSGTGFGKRGPYRAYLATSLWDLWLCSGKSFRMS
jgi:hypothetical protein